MPRVTTFTCAMAGWSTDDRSARAAQSCVPAVAVGAPLFRIRDRSRWHQPFLFLCLRLCFRFWREDCPPLPAELPPVPLPFDISSSSGSSGLGAAKSAVAGLTRALAREFADAGVRVNAVAPGTMRTADNVAQMKDAKVHWVELADLVRAARTTQVVRKINLA